MLKAIFSALVLLFILEASASDSLPVSMNGRLFRAGDTARFTWDGHAIGKGLPRATIHLWVDHLESGKRWKFRYPVVNGVSGGYLAVSPSLEEGTYAFNFLASDQFLEISGEAKKLKIKTALNYKTRKMDTILLEEQPGLMGKQIAYAFMDREEGLLLDSVMTIDAMGRFRIPPVIFGDTVNLILDANKFGDRYRFDMKTPLDTTFVPFYQETIFVRVEGPENLKPADTGNYVFNFVDRYPNAITLEEVKVSGVAKGKKFEKDYVSPVFKSVNHRTFDFTESDELMRYGDIWTFIQSRTPGLIFRSNGPMPMAAVWRGAPVRFFLDEMPISPSDMFIPPMEVAMIKVYPPNTPLMASTPGGAVAIYSRRGGYENPGQPRYNYVVRGYTQPEINWE